MIKKQADFLSYFFSGDKTSNMTEERPNLNFRVAISLACERRRISCCRLSQRRQATVGIMCAFAGYHLARRCENNYLWHLYLGKNGNFEFL